MNVFRRNAHKKNITKSRKNIKNITKINIKKISRKSIKSRKNKSQKKKRVGGKINAFTSSPRVNVTIEIPYNEIEFAKSKLSTNVEYCGKYVVDNIDNIFSGKKIVLRQDDTNVGNFSQRAYCDIRNKGLYSVVWHTHPNSLKFYPSLEDIIMVKKVRNMEQIKLSIIYTSIGIWLLESLDGVLSQTIIDNIEVINTNFYRRCFKGRTTTPNYNFETVLHYINNVYNEEMYNNCNMNITFLPYDNTGTQTILYNLTNVRIDSLTP